MTHEVFILVYQQLDRFEQGRPLRPWLFGFAYRVAAGYRRLARHRVETRGDLSEVTDPAPSTVDQLATRQSLELAWKALDALDLDRRAVFVLHEVEAMRCPRSLAPCKFPSIPRTRVFGYVLDIEMLKTATSTTVPDPSDYTKGMRYLVPGDPDRSWMFLRIAAGQMPPPDLPGLVMYPRPTVSETALLRSWITSCLGDDPLAPSADAGGSGGALVDARTPPPPWPTDDDCRSGAQLPIVGTWDGYIENYKFASGSDAVHVVITAANATRVCGTVTLGQGTPPAPATDPNVGYPPPLAATAGTIDSGMPRSIPDLIANPIEGYPMTMLQGQSSPARIQFGLAQRELWKSWCDLQTPYSSRTWQDSPTTPDSYACAPPLGKVGTDGACVAGNTQPIDCVKLQLCESGACDCTSSNCTVSPVSTIAFDFHVQSDTQLVGSVALGGLHNVYLDKAP